MKMRSKDPRPPGIMLTIPAHAATIKIANKSLKGMEILITDAKSQITKKIADHSRIETKISKNFICIVMDGSGSFLSLHKVMIIKVGRYNPTPITAK